MGQIKRVLLRIENERGDHAYVEEDDAEEFIASCEDTFRITERAVALFVPLMSAQGLRD